jgi:hypothetical protein
MVLVFATTRVAVTDSSSRSGGCPNLARAKRDPSMLHRDWLRGDVDGDGRADTVAIAEDKSAGLRCRFAVVVLSAQRSYVLPLGRWWILKPGDVIGQPWPLIRLLARVDDRRGAEILVALSHGASFEQGELVTLREGELRRIRLPKNTPLDYGSIAPTGVNFDCASAGSGRVVRAWYSARNAQGSRWQYALDFYRLKGLVLQKTGRRSVILRANIAKGRYPRVPRWWSRYDAELSPFRHCAVVRDRTPA